MWVELSQPFLKHSNHWKRALKIIFKGSVTSSFLKLSLLLQRKKPTLNRTWVTTSSRCFIGVESAVYNGNKQVMLELSVVRYQVLLCFDTYDMDAIVISSRVRIFRSKYGV